MDSLHASVRLPCSPGPDLAGTPSSYHDGARGRRAPSLGHPARLRRFGVTSLGDAGRAEPSGCVPQATVQAPPDHEPLPRVPGGGARWSREIFRSVTPSCSSHSLDEAFLDVPGPSGGLVGPRQSVNPSADTRPTMSSVRPAPVGVAPSKLCRQARLRAGKARRHGRSVPVDEAVPGSSNRPVRPGGVGSEPRRKPLLRPRPA